MNTAITTRRPQDRALPDGALVCRSCGRAVKRPDPARTETLRIFGPAFASATARGIPASPFEMPVTRCDDCSARRAGAQALLNDHPRIARAHGSVALDRLDAALAALDLGGLLGRGKMLADLTATDDRLQDLIGRLASLGAAASWGARGVTTASPKRWSHVPAELAEDIRTEQARLVRRLVEFPFPFSPPGSSTGAVAGCLLCGVGSLKVRESDALAAWGDEFRIDPGVVGGRPRPEPVTGHLCPKCRSSLSGVGAVGMPAVERAMLAHFGYAVTVGRSLDFHNNLRAWVALRPGTAPNATPWAHLGDSMASDLADLEARGHLVRKARR